ncbi:solute-binding protein [bacterium 1xD8-48]|jgi:cell division protein YceG involved in septum cleavage|nr:endolytic transglycosylase MltG [Lachnospiraceae bacterium]MCI9327543.1 endolytic transglycosylase MltG [Lachnospiraceae bacterium]NBJ98037.1 solute-binding protein [bacterium 1xD8-48]
MNVKYLIITMLETIVKIVILAAVVVFVFRTSTQAYDFGYRVFADEPMSVSGGRTITVGIAEDASLKEIANMLEEKGLIEDANLFIVQELLSAYHGKILPGIYDLSTDMKAEQMLEILSTSTEEEGEEEKE